jgi:hypothetical protein
MISRGMLLGVLIAAAALGVGAVVVHIEFARQSTPGINPSTSAPTSRWMKQQQQAEQKSEQEGIEAACAALRKMGQTDKNCPPQ